jgi:hypothetical protein
MGDKNSIFNDYRSFNPQFFARGSKYDARRSHLFVTMRQKVPGGFSKASLFWVLTCSAFGALKFVEYRHEVERLQVAKFPYMRKAIPFLNVVEHRRQAALAERREIIQAELFKDDPEAYEALRRTTNDPTLAMPADSNGTLTALGLRRSSKNKWREYNTFHRGNDAYMQNDPSEHF